MHNYYWMIAAAGLAWALKTFLTAGEDLTTLRRSKRFSFLLLLGAVSEELLFRGVLMPVAGLWVSNLLFVVLHKPKSLKNSLYLAAVGFFMSWLASYSIYLAIAAHTIINLAVNFWHLNKK